MYAQGTGEVVAGNMAGRRIHGNALMVAGVRV